MNINVNSFADIGIFANLELPPLKSEINKLTQEYEAHVERRRLEHENMMKKVKEKEQQEKKNDKVCMFNGISWEDNLLRPDN